MIREKPYSESSSRKLNILLILIIIGVLPALLYLYRRSKDSDYLQQARQSMVEKQIEARGISDSEVLRAMAEVPRHEFVPNLLIPRAYSDGPLPIGQGQTISQPYIVALMSEVLNVEEGMKVLEIGTGSGYQAAVLAEMNCRVYTIEIIPELAKWGRKNVEDCNYTNVEFRIGNGYNGWPKHAPFDRIIVTCAPEAIPKPLLKQLSEDGKMVIPVGKKGMTQSLTLVSKENGEAITDEIIPVRFVPMLDKDGQ